MEGAVSSAEKAGQEWTPELENMRARLRIWVKQNPERAELARGWHEKLQELRDAKGRASAREQQRRWRRAEKDLEKAQRDLDRARHEGDAAAQAASRRFSTRLEEWQRAGYRLGKPIYQKPTGKHRAVATLFFATKALLDEGFPFEESTAERALRAERIVWNAWAMLEDRETVLGVEFAVPDPDRQHERSFWWYALEGDGRRRWLELIDHAFAVLGIGSDPQGPEETNDLPAKQSLAPPYVDHAPDFSWLRVRGEQYEFTTPRQRQIIGVLFRRWQAGGDQALTTEAAILEELDESIERLRVRERFKNSPALNAILFRGTGAEAAWRLHLGPPSSE